MTTRFFTGRYSLTMDAKGRIGMPARWRHLLGGSDDQPARLYLVKDLQYPSVRLLLPEEYEAQASQFVQLSGYEGEEKRVRLFFFGEADDCVLRGERQMLLLNQGMREHMGCALGDKLELVGEGNYATLWHPERLDEKMSGKKVRGERPVPLSREVMERYGIWSGAPRSSEPEPVL